MCWPSCEALLKSIRAASKVKAPVNHCEREPPQLMCFKEISWRGSGRVGTGGAAPSPRTIHDQIGNASHHTTTTKDHPNLHLHHVSFSRRIVIVIILLEALWLGDWSTDSLGVLVALFVHVRSGTRRLVGTIPPPPVISGACRRARNNVQSCRRNQAAE